MIMKTLSRITLAGAASLVLLGCSADKASTSKTTVAADKHRVSGLLSENFDRNVRPQDDFYRFVNGKWLATTEIPAEKSNYGMFTLLDDKSQQSLREILESAAATKDATGDTQKVGDFFASFMDEAKVESLGLTPLSPELARINAIRTSRDLAVAIGRLQRVGVGQPFAYFVSIDEKNSSHYISYVYQQGTTLPDRDYYLSDDAKMKAVREQYKTYVRDLLAAAGETDTAKMADHVLALETRLAKSQWTRVQNRDAEKTYNKFGVADIQKQMPDFDWRAFFEGAASPQVDALVVSQPSFFKDLNGALAQIPLAQWREFLRFQLLDGFAPYLNKQFVDLHFGFHGQVLSGIVEQRPRWKRGVQVVENSIGEIAGKLYVERHFGPEAKHRVQELVNNIERAYSQGIDQLDWMSPATKLQAHAKLQKFTAKIGFPDKWQDWSGLQVKRDDIIGNIIRATIVDYDRNIKKLGEPVDRTEWHMTPQTVNAYYNPPSNEIVFPAAILQPPFFDPAADDAVNYGAIGTVIGHEISHGFDDQGRHYDGDGNLNNWWDDADDKEFRVRADALTKQYNAFSPIAGLNVNGELTLGENIADLVGIAMAHRAYRLSLNGKEAPVLDGFTGDQRFFIGFAQVWARKYREDEMRKRLLTDPHSPSEYRVNGIVVNQPAFYAAFNLKPEDKMYRAVEARVKIW